MCAVSNTAHDRLPRKRRRQPHPRHRVEGRDERGNADRGGSARRQSRRDAPVALAVDLAGSTTTTAPTTTTTASGGGTGGTGGAAGCALPGTLPGALPGARRLADGSVSIPAKSVTMPYRLVIKQVRFSPGTIRAHNQRISVGYRIADTRGDWVRDAPSGCAPCRSASSARSRQNRRAWAGGSASPSAPDSRSNSNGEVG